MSWLSKGVRKLKRNVKHVIGNKAWNFGKSFLDVASLGTNYMLRKTGEEYNRNETLYNTIALSIGAGILSGGALGALGGALGAGTTAAGGAATGAIAGAASGVEAGAQMQAAEDAAKIAQEAAAEQERLAKLQAGAMPTEVSSTSVEAKKYMSSNYKRNQLSRQKSSLGGASSTLG